MVIFILMEKYPLYKCEQWGNFKENEHKSHLYTAAKRNSRNLRTKKMRKERLENKTLTGILKSEKPRLTCPSSYSN